MNEPNMIFMTHSSARLRNVELRNRHKQLIEQKKLVDAANLIKDRKDVDAFTASLFNSLEQKIVYVESLLSEMEAKQYTVVSQDEPSDSEMDGKFFWEQEYEQEEDWIL